MEIHCIIAKVYVPKVCLGIWTLKNTQLHLVIQLLHWKGCTAHTCDSFVGGTQQNGWSLPCSILRNGIGQSAKPTHLSKCMFLSFVANVIQLKYTTHFPTNLRIIQSKSCKSYILGKFSIYVNKSLGHHPSIETHSLPEMKTSCSNRKMMSCLFVSSLLAKGCSWVSVSKRSAKAPPQEKATKMRGLCVLMASAICLVPSWQF